MDLDSRLANLSLGEIASLLSPKQQEVLLASISVAASLIQQIQQEDSMHQQQQHLNNSNNHQTEIEDSIQLHYSGGINSNTAAANNNNNNNNNSININNNINNINNNTSTANNLHLHHQTELEDESIDQDEEFDHEDQLSDTEDSNDEQHHDLHHQPQQHNQRHRNQQQQHHHQTDMLQETDEKDLLTIRQFAEELKHRRKSIRLSQKGAAQSLRAFTGGVQPCTDAIIYHFENLQLEPERAMQLIPLLRDWLEWAEKHRYNGKQLPMMSAVTKVPRERKRKVVLFNEKAKQYLEDAFMKNNHPDRYQLDVISQELNIPTRSIRKWFTNRRQRKRFAEKFSPIAS